MSEPLYKHSEKALAANVGDDVVALNVEYGHCYGMEKVTATVWNLMSEPIDIERICNRLVRHYEVEPDVCRAEVENLIGQLRKEGLVDTVQPAG